MLIAERKRVKNQINQIQDPEEKRELQAQYWTLNIFLKRSAGIDKRRSTEELTKEAETAAGQRNMKNCMTLPEHSVGKNSNPSRPVKDKKPTLK